MSGQRLPLSLWLRLCRWLWKYPLPFLFSTLIINIAINIGSTWLITPATTKTVPDTSIAGNITGWVSAHWVFSLILSATSIALLLVTWRGSREPAESASSVPTQVQMSARDRERLLKRLRVRYEQLLAQSFQGAVEIELGLTSRPAAIQNAVSLSLRLPEQPERALPAHTSILDAYNLAQQELLILGEPGAGKSMLLMKLAHHLVEQAEQDVVQPLPVVLPLSSWATKRLSLRDWLIEQFTLLPVVLPLSSWTTKRLSLQDWLIEQFALLYDVPRQLSHNWMQAGLILPLLDGLDEMETSARPTCIIAINTYHREHLQPLVVCSRTTEYDAATRHERLALHTAVVVQPLTLKQIDTHLATIGKPLTALRTALKKNTTLQTLATTPLLLQILMLTYHGIPVRALSHRKDQLQEQIWDDYVLQMVSRKGNKTRYPLKQTCVWLSYLAGEMRLHNQSVLFLEQLQPDWLPEKQRFFYRSCMILTITLIVGLFEALVWALIFFIPEVQLHGLSLALEGIPIALSGIIPQGLFLGLALGLYVAFRAIQPAELLSWSRTDIRSRLFISLAIGLSGGGALFIFRALGIKTAGKQLTKRLSLSPNEGIRRSAKNGVMVAFPLGLLVGIFFGLGTILLMDPVFRLHVGSFGAFLFELGEGFFYASLIGLVLAFVFGLDAFIQHYILRFWLWRSHLFPLKAVPFLEDATARTLFRRVGGGYSFTHRLLLDYFADRQTTTPAPLPDPRPLPQSPQS